MAPTPLAEQLVQSLLSNYWLLQPGLMAEHLSGGAWKPYKHLNYISQKLAEMAYRPLRLILCMPPRMGKSELVSHWLPVWIITHWPQQKVLLASYEATFAASWGRKARDTIQANAEALGVQIREDVGAIDAWETPQGGGMVTTGVGGPITGRGGHLIIDDPHKNSAEARSPLIRDGIWDWYKRTARTRLEPGASIIIAMQRWNRQDLVGKLLAEGTEDWGVINLPAMAERNDLLLRQEHEALWPERYNLEALGKLKEAIGPDGWVSQYQQRPEQMEGDCFFDVSVLVEMEKEATKGQVFAPYAVMRRYGAWIDTAGEGSDNHSLSVVGGYGVVSGFVVDYTTKEPVDLYAQKAYDLLKSYNFPLLGIESNGVGQSMLLAFKVLRYPEDKLVYSDPKREKKGVVMTGSLRDFILSRFAETLRQRQAVIYSREAIEECLNFIKFPSGGPRAASGAHDDRVMAMAGATWVAGQLPPSPLGGKPAEDLRYARLG